jgi:hypothetical protein
VRAVAFVDLRVVPLVDYVGMEGLPASKSYALPADLDGHRRGVDRRSAVLGR